jgi:KUP system potassium uptake protein
VSKNINKVSAAGLVIALGIIYGDIGTSPLYVLNEIINGRVISEFLILGCLSCIIWTLTLQTTIKYVILTLKADNKGEGGIFSLYALVRRRRKWLVVPAMLGGAALLADGMITPPITVTSAIEGLRQIPALHDITQRTIIGIVIGIITVIYFVQQFGTASIGKLFGPIMCVFFSMLAVLGASHLVDDIGFSKPSTLITLLNYLHNTPKVSGCSARSFFVPQGAESLYSDLGHCGKGNIRISWIFVKTCLLLNYLGQGAWLLANYHNQIIPPDVMAGGFNPFIGIMPIWFKLPGIIISTMAAVIACQALISGSFTLISEAMRLNLWPKMKINYPTEEKGQLYIQGISLLLYIGCVGVVLYFQKSANMGAAYGLAITMCMISTSILFANFLVSRRVDKGWIYLYLSVYLTIELHS